jgi:glycine/D-amino acid oxidase-like deaminating enzyme/nitrite reductase/ring-hydroxylating ferredoxin subunit
METTTIQPRDGQLESAWQNILPQVTGHHNFNPNIVYDCLIVGAGITGLTAAVPLQQAGKKVIVVDAHTIGYGTTGGTSAHINTFADNTYKDTEDAFGEDGAKLFAAAILEACTIIKANVTNYSIDCDYAVKTGYIYAEDDAQATELEDIYKATAKVGVAVKPAGQVPTPVPYQSALELAGQAQFHPLKYLQGLTNVFLQAGGTLVENLKIEDVKSENGLHTGITAAGHIKAAKVIYATHIPPGLNVFSVRCAPYRSYVIAVKLNNGDYPDALVYDMQEPYHYIRTHEINGEKLLLVGGNDHKTGHDDPAQAFADLEDYTRTYYDVAAVAYKWSSQYYVPVDGLPYVGQVPFMTDGILTATGYNGNGMMLGTIAGKILSDIVLEQHTPYSKIFDTKRLKPIDGFTEFVKENADVAYHFVADRFNIKESESLNSIPAGTGKIVEVDGEKIAVYRDEAGTVHALSPVCTHAKCIVNWNPEEKSWDCPCHGARYDINGKVLTGPADRDLEKIG